MSARKLYEKLERYEDTAVHRGQGVEWVEAVGDGFKMYAKHCADNGKRMTVAGFVRWIDKLALEWELDSEETDE